MDIPAPKAKTKINIKVLIAWIRFSQVKPTLSINHDDIMVATVQQEDFVVDVRAPGTLQPKSLRWIAASSEGRVEQIYIQPGERVTKDTRIMLLSNPTLVRNLESAGYALQVEEAELKALDKRLQSNYLSQEAVVADYEARYQNATFRLKANEALSGLKIVSELDAKANALQQAQLSRQLAIEKKRLTQLIELNKAELEAKQAQVNQARSMLSLQQELTNNLDVRAGLDGILQQVPVEQGQQVTSGVVLARVAQEDKFKAELRVQESQAKDISLGQSTTIQAGNQITVGKIIRVDPAVQNGVVIVDVAIPEGELTSARPDLRITARIEVEKQTDVLTLRRPVASQPNTEARLYVLNASDQSATRQTVLFGKSSVEKIHILDGLQAGARVIISDTRSYSQARSLTVE